MTKSILIFLSIAAFSVSATASTPEAWKQLDRRVDKACLSAAGLDRAKIVSDKASFSDGVPIELRIVEGYNKGSVVDVKLCVFDRRTGRAATTDGSGRLGVHRN